MSGRPASAPDEPAEEVSLIAVDRDDDGVSAVRCLDLLADGRRDGIPGALVTVTEVTGGGPRPVGTHMAVLADGRYAGYVSGGCIEPAIAREVIAMIAQGMNGVIRIGAGSPWIDLRLPCGGGLSLDVIVNPPVSFVTNVAAAIRERRDVCVPLGRWEPGIGPTGWQGGEFRRRYVPDVRLLVIGDGREADVLARIAGASGLAVDRRSSDAIAELAADRRTAIVVLDHDHHREQPALRQALASNAFYVGAMGSVRTQAIRASKLREAGVADAALARLHAPIGVAGRARDARALAFSILAEIAAEAARDEALVDAAA